MRYSYDKPFPENILIDAAKGWDGIVPDPEDRASDWLGSLMYVIYSRLTKRDREYLFLMYHEHMNTSQVAQNMGVKSGQSVHNHIHKALRRVRKYMFVDNHIGISQQNASALIHQLESQVTALRDKQNQSMQERKPNSTALPACSGTTLADLHDSLSIDTRTYNCLYQYFRFHTQYLDPDAVIIDEISQLLPKVLAQVRNFGRGSAQKLLKALSDNGCPYAYTSELMEYFR